MMSRVSQIFLFALFVAFASCAQVVRFDLTTANPVTANQFGPTSTSGCSASNLAFNGLTAVNAAGWTFTGWPTSTARDETKYVTFSITPNAGQPLKVKTINLGYDIAVSNSQLNPHYLLLFVNLLSFLNRLVAPLLSML
jgi:hypothetical protein